MKKLILMMVVTITTLLNFSCHKESISSVERGTFSAKVENENINVSGNASIFSVFGMDIFDITGVQVSSQGDTALIILRLNFPSTVSMESGNFNFESNECLDYQGENLCGVCTYAFMKNGVQTNYLSHFDDGVFEMKISDIDYRSGGFVEGTFSSTLQNEDDFSDTKIITNGKFNVSIQ